MTQRKKTAPFEKNLEQLEALVDEMEAGNLSLDEAFKAFERGLKLSHECQQAVTEVEHKVSLLLNPESGLQPFEVDNAD